MKQVVTGLLATMAFCHSCRTAESMAVIQPKSGTIELPSKGETRVWNNTTHPSFSVTLVNSSATQSCEVYKVTASGSETWISPSLQAGKALTLTIPSDGHLFVKNFNDNALMITYKVAE